MPFPLNPQLLPKVVTRLKALADENRIRLLLRLKAGPCNVGMLSQELQIAQASTSKHLSMLRQAGLVKSTRRGTQILYSVSDRSIYDLCSLVCDGVVRHLKAEHAALNLTPRSARKGKRS